MARSFKPQIINGKTQAVGHKTTMVHGLISNNTKQQVESIISKINNPNIVNIKIPENQTKYLKILKPKQYIAFE
jgi:hypothetical protein